MHGRIHNLFKHQWILNLVLDIVELYQSNPSYYQILKWFLDVQSFNQVCLSIGIRDKLNACNLTCVSIEVACL